LAAQFQEEGTMVAEEDEGKGEGLVKKKTYGEPLLNSMEARVWKKKRWQKEVRQKHGIL